MVLTALALLSLLAPGLRAQTAPAPVTTITLGQSIVPLNGPWKFHIGDNPAWADPDFDDSQWETVDLTPKAGSFDPIGGLPNYVPGWTAKGHPGYSGYAWYRLRVRVATPAGQKLALAGPADVDDAYQVFANGRLLGSFGKFPASGGRPVIYVTQPRMFALPPAQGDRSGTRVLAFRVWMSPITLTHDPDAGGMHTAPLLGEAGVVRARYQLAWLALVRAYSSAAIEAAIFLLLAVLALSLRLFDPEDPVYLWLAGVFLLTAIDAAVVSVASWSSWIGDIALQVAQDVFFRPLMLGGWAMVWWVWFRLRRPAWIPGLIAGLTVVYGLAQGVGDHLLLPGLPAAAVRFFHALSLTARLLFLPLLVWIVIRGVRRQGREGWLALPAVALAVIARFEHELGVLHVRVIWFPFDVVLSLGQIASFLLVAAIGALLLRRALLAVRRQRQEALDAMALRFDDRLAERTRIAREFHDTLLQTIQGSKLVADSALRQSSDPARMHAAIQQLSVWLGQATEEGRAALNSLRSSTTQTNDLAEAFRRFIGECEIQSETHASFSLTGQASEMHPIVRDEIYRIGCEAIRNACAHAQASRVQVELSYGDDLTLCVRDNGVGIDPAALNQGKQGHFGLQGMRERAGRITSRLTIDTATSSGTEIKLVVPGSIIYRRSLGTAQKPGTIKMLLHRMSRKAGRPGS